MNEKQTLVRPLRAGPLDVVGDIHGELATLNALLERLGYDAEGRHPEGRRLVFVGDLVDRGPDSPGVVARVRPMVESGQAQMVLGNHEFNLVRGKRMKQGSHWFYDRDLLHAEDTMPGRRVTEADERRAMRRFFLTQPLALEREDLRVVHACWDPAAIERARRETELLEFSAREEERVSAAIEAEGVGEESARLRATLRVQPRPPFHRAIGREAELKQTHAVRSLTGGAERLLPEDGHFFSAGKWRFAHRVAWWREYEDEAPVVVGHYWRSATGSGGMGGGGPLGDPLHGVPPSPVGLGPKGNVYVIDFSVGRGYRQRLGEVEGCTLAALRWPERELVMQPLVE